MSTDFTRPEHKTPGGRFRAGPGMVGTQAGLQAGRAQPGKAAGPARPSRSNPPDGKGRGGGLGLPDMGSKPPDYRHLILLAQHHNMTDLGNDAPFGIQAINNGHFRQMFEPGKMPFDIFWDV